MLPPMRHGCCLLPAARCIMPSLSELTNVDAGKLTRSDPFPIRLAQGCRAAAFADCSSWPGPARLPRRCWGRRRRVSQGLRTYAQCCAARLSCTDNSDGRSAVFHLRAQPTEGDRPKGISSGLPSSQWPCVDIVPASRQCHPSHRLNLAPFPATVDPSRPEGQLSSERITATPSNPERASDREWGPFRRRRRQPGQYALAFPVRLEATGRGPAQPAQPMGGSNSPTRAHP